MRPSDDKIEPIYDIDAVQQWRQGDYSLTMPGIVLVDDTEDGNFVPFLDENLLGLVVVTQTCDIVNVAKGKDYVVVCPLIEVNEQSLNEVMKGRAPSAAVLEHPPVPEAVVDFGRMMSVHKRVLTKFERMPGFSSDAGRMAFADALQRKHGRFAFPDKFNSEILSKLRERAQSAHKKIGSAHGKVYRSIRTVRAAAEPNWDATEISIRFFYVIEPDAKREATRAEIAVTLTEHFKKLKWPSGYVAADPAFELLLLEDMNAADWISSQPIDWDFISSTNASLQVPPPVTAEDYT